MITSLSATPSSSGAQKEESGKAAARVWGQTEEGVRSYDRRPYRPGGHALRNTLIVLLIIALFLFVPMIGTQNGYVSIIEHLTGVGGEYMTSGWGSHYFVGHITLENGNAFYGFGLGSYYFAV